MSKQTHTPTPWKIETTGSCSCNWVITDDGKSGIPIFEILDDDGGQANAEFIVRACNSHEELLEALKLHQRFWDEMPKGQLGKLVCDIGVLNQAFLKTRSAIAKAQGEISCA